MSQSNQFWRFAEEAMLDARHAKNEPEKLAPLDLARWWTQAALQSEGTLVVTANLDGTKATNVAAARMAVIESQIVLASNHALFIPNEPTIPKSPSDEPDKSPVEEPQRNNPQEDTPMRDPQQPDNDKPRMM